MKYLLVVGSRSITDYRLVSSVLDKYCDMETVIISGGAGGVDFLAEKYADEHGLEKVIMKADWNRHGKRAGYIRNAQMHEYISRYDDRLCIAFWDGRSKGTAHSFKLAEEYKNPIEIITIEKEQ